MLWTRDAEEALENAEDDREIMLYAKKNFLSLLSTLIKQTTYDLTKFDRVKYETLVTIHVHQADIFNDLVGPRDRWYFYHKYSYSVGRLFSSSCDNDAVNKPLSPTGQKEYQIDQ